jgi:prefoldin subunit 5
MPTPEVERLATLEAEMRSVQSDISEIKASLKTLEKIAAQGGGAFHAVLMLGGMIGWLFGVSAAIYTAMRE